MVNLMRYFLLMTVFILISGTVLKADDTMYIGVLAPITGELRKEGFDVIRSARIAADQLNSIKGQVNSTKGQVNSTKGQVNSTKGRVNSKKGLVDKRIEIIFRNSASSLQVAKPALSDLLENQKCEAIITCDSEMITGMVSDICETREIPFAIVNGFSSDRPFKFSFTEHPSPREIVKTAALWLNKNHGGEKILLVNREKGIGEGFEPVFQDIFERNQIIKTIRVQKESFAFREVNDFLKKGKPGISLILLSGENLLNLLAEMDNQGNESVIMAPFLNLYSAEDAGAFDIHGVETVLPWTKAVPHADMSPPEVAYVNEYIKRHLRYPGSSGFYTFSAVNTCMKRMGTSQRGPLDKNRNIYIVRGNDPETTQHDNLYMNYFSIIDTLDPGTGGWKNEH